MQTVTQLSQPRECTMLGVYPDLHEGFWVATLCQYSIISTIMIVGSSIVTNVTILLQDVDSGERCA